MSNVNQPKNKNFLSALGFDFSLQRLPTTSFSVVRCTLPGLSADPVLVKTPFTQIPMPNDKIQWGTFQMTFKVDEDMENWLEIFDWMTGLGFPESFEQRASLKGLSSDASLVILTNKKNSNLIFNFQNLFPTQLSEVDFNVQTEDVEYPEATVTFVYTQFKLDRGVTAPGT